MAPQPTRWRKGTAHLLQSNVFSCRILYQNGLGLVTPPVHCQSKRNFRFCLATSWGLAGPGKAHFSTLPRGLSPPIFPERTITSTWSMNVFAFMSSFRMFWMPAQGNASNCSTKAPAAWSFWRFMAFQTGVRSARRGFRLASCARRALSRWQRPAKRRISHGHRRATGG